MYNRLDNGQDECESDDEDCIDSDEGDGQSDVWSDGGDSDSEYAGDEDITGPPTPQKVHEP